MAEQDVAREETTTLIASDKVEGTAVFNHRGEKLGSIHNLMVDKRSGRVQYAVLTFGGVMGMGADFYPLPWTSLTYDASLGGYMVGLKKETLQDAPHYAASQEPAFDKAYGQTVFSHYGQSYPII